MIKTQTGVRFVTCGLNKPLLKVVRSILSVLLFCVKS